MKRIIYVLLLMSPLINACAPSCGGKNLTRSSKKEVALEAPEKTVILSYAGADQAYLNNELFRAVAFGWPNIVQQLIMAKADVQALDPADQKSSTYKAGLLVVEACKDNNVRKTKNYLEVLACLEDAGAHQSKDLKSFYNKEPFKTAFTEQLIQEEGFSQEAAERALNRTAHGKPLTTDCLEKKEDTK